LNRKTREAAAAYAIAPKTVHNERGETVEVILSYAGYRTLLRLLASCADWESLPPDLQDAIDSLLAEEAKQEPGESIPLRQALREFGELP